MKTCHRILTMAFFLMVACTPKGDDGLVETRHGTSLPTTSSPELAVVDSLMWRQPDSALARLLPYFDTCCRDAMIASPVTTDGDFIETHAIETHAMRLYNRHYAHLLLAELLYKNDYAQTNRAELLDAVGYFDSLMADTRGVSVQGSRRRDARRASAKNTAFLDARAHYINGVGYYEHDSLVDACKEYLKALEVMEGHFEEEELVGEKAIFMAYAYTRLTDLFSNLYFHEQAIYFAQWSLPYYQKQDIPSWYSARMLCEIGTQYDMMKNYDSAFFYYHKSLMVLSDTSSLMHRDLVTHLAYLSYEKGGLPKTSINQLQRLIRQSETPKEALTRCSLIGEIYYTEKTYDSAWVYLNKVFHESQSLDSKKQVAEWLAEICKIQGRENSIIEYAGFLVPFATQDEDKGIIKTQLAELYNKYKQQTLEHQHIIKIKRQTRWSTCVLFGVLLLMSTVYVLYRKNKRKKQNLEMQIKEEQYTHEIRQKALLGRLKRSNEALRTLKKEANNLAKEKSIQQRQTKWDHLNDFMNESICNDILTAIRDKQIKREAKNGDYPELHLNNAQLHDLSIAVEKHFQGFEKTLTELNPKISRNAMYQCQLYLLNIEDVQIAALLSCDYSTVKRRSTKLRQAFGTEKELRQFIREFVL